MSPHETLFLELALFLGGSPFMWWSDTFLRRCGGRRAKNSESRASCYSSLVIDETLLKFTAEETPETLQNAVTLGGSCSFERFWICIGAQDSMLLHAHSTATNRDPLIGFCKLFTGRQASKVSY